MSGILPAKLDSTDGTDRARRLEARLRRERQARHEAERLLETKSLQLYEANQALSELAAGLEHRVAERTSELSTERKLALDKAEIDALTGISNRAGFGRKLAEALTGPSATSEGLAVVLLDLDDFKAVNDTLGHAAGDALLIEFSNRLVAAVRPGDVVARLGGDEFGLIAHAVGNRQGSFLMAHRLLRALCTPALITGRRVLCSCSIGIVDAPLAGASRAVAARCRHGPICVQRKRHGLRDDV